MRHNVTIVLQGDTGEHLHNCVADSESAEVAVPGEEVRAFIKHFVVVDGCEASKSANEGGQQQFQMQVDLSK